jgi:malonate-semialdehyde dehydrogenase (acetylating) / methylmalonate-semialdehyde dehydrogenase
MSWGSFQQAIRDNADAVAEIIVLEQGKTLTDAHGDLYRGLQVVQAAASITSTLMGNQLEGCCLLIVILMHLADITVLVSKDIDTYNRRLPLGVCASIAPFNFPV